MPALGRQRKIRGRLSASNLSSEEAFLCSRIGNGIEIGELLRMCPWSEDETLKLIESAMAKHAIEFLDEKKSSAVSFEQEISEKFESVKSTNPYETLGVNKYATTKEIKDTYLKLSKKFHPDRFFSRDLGPLKEKLEFIFSRIQKSYSVLKNPIEREALDRITSAQSSITHKDKSARTSSLKSLDPEMVKKGKAESYYKKGLEQEKSGHFVEAYNSFLLATQLIPGRESYEKALEAVRPQMQRQRALHDFEVAKNKVQSDGPSKELLRAVEDALKMDPHMSEAHLLFGRLILDLGLLERVRDAKEMLLRAKAKMPNSAEPCYHLARCFLSSGDGKSAKKELKEALKRDSKHAASQKLLKTESFS